MELRRKNVSVKVSGLLIFKKIISISEGVII